MRSLAAAALALTLAGCVHAKADLTTADLTNQKAFGMIWMGGSVGYLIDPRTEGCFLATNGETATMVAVDCAKLKRNVPEAARYITWDAPSAAACGDVPPPAASPAPAVSSRP